MVRLLPNHHAKPLHHNLYPKNAAMRVCAHIKRWPMKPSNSLRCFCVGLTGELNMAMVGSKVEAAEHTHNTHVTMQCEQGQETWLNRWPLRSQDYGTREKEFGTDARSGADLFVQPEANDEPGSISGCCFSSRPTKEKQGRNSSRCPTSGRFGRAMQRSRSAERGRQPGPAPISPRPAIEKVPQPDNALC